MLGSQPDRSSADRNLLVVEADAPTRERLVATLRHQGYEPTLASSADAALAALERGPYFLTFLSAHLDGIDGLELLGRIRQNGGDPGAIVLVADESDMNRVPEALALGAEDVIPWDFAPADLAHAIEAARLRPRPAAAGSAPRATDQAASQLRRELALWRSPVMREVWRVIEQAAQVDVTVLIGGETGTGKDLVARAIHLLSSRRHEPLVKVNCAAVPRELLETELFGHERGAFTGAHQLKVGKFEVANRGTIFLDEIGDLHPALQAKLLHVLQDGTFSRVGGKASIQVDVRVLAATNLTLEREVASGRFRDDLYYRLNVIQIVVPPLRQRVEEIPVLAQYFAQRYAKLFRRESFALTRAALDRLAQHSFPGNVRELENVVKRMIVLDDPDLARTPFLPTSDTGAAGPASPEGRRTALDPVPPARPNGAGAGPRPVGSLKEIARSAARQAEREVIQRVLAETGWNRVRAAKLLRISYRALLYKIKEVGLDRASAAPR